MTSYSFWNFLSETHLVYGLKALKCLQKKICRKCPKLILNELRLHSNFARETKITPTLALCEVSRSLMDEDIDFRTRK